MTNVWNAVTKEFFEGWKQGPTREQIELIEYFIKRPRYKTILEKFIAESLLNEVIELNSYSQYTKVLYIN